MVESFNYDVFLSHSSKDKPAVRELAERLRNDGLRVWLDDWEIRPGDMIGLKIEQGLEQSRTLVLVMSVNAFASEWVMLERHTAMFRDPMNQQRRFIPVRLDDAEIKETLRQFAYVDWRQRSDEQYVRLLAACRSAASQMAYTIKQKELSRQGKILRAHTDRVTAVAVTPDGRRIISGSADKTVRLWEVDSGKCIAAFEGHTDTVNGVTATPDGQYIVTASQDSTVRIWEIDSGECFKIFEKHTSAVHGVAVMPGGKYIISGSEDGSARLWRISDGRHFAIDIYEIENNKQAIFAVTVTPDGKYVAIGSEDKTIHVQGMDNWGGIGSSIFEGHTDVIRGLAITPNGRHIASASSDRTVRVWDINSKKCLTTLEGHTSTVRGVAITPDGRCIVSISDDETIKLWEIDSGSCIATLKGHSGPISGVALTPNGLFIVTSSYDTTLRVWELPRTQQSVPVKARAIRYTNAKVLLVGETGVGKSGLAIRITEDRFEATISTDAVWATQMKLPHNNNNSKIERDIWLWDFGGQSDYRLIHQLFMDETSVAVLVFNPQNENPFEGLGQWDRDLEKAARRKFMKILVAGRCDRGGPIVSQKSIEHFCWERGFARYLETSALTGKGCNELRDAIIRNIAWGEIPWTSSPRIFKLLKEEIIKLKDEGKVLLRMGEMKQQLEMQMLRESSQENDLPRGRLQSLWQKVARQTDEQSAPTFTPEELRAVVGLLAGPGVIWQMEFGDFVLLRPEYINAYAAVVIRTVRAHRDELGSIAEKQILAGELDYQEMKRLPRNEEHIVLRAMHQTLVDHGLCLRENTETGALLIFPSYFKRERPELKDHPPAFVTYSFSGMLEEIYATLIVRLHHTTAFEKDQLWRFAADFKTLASKRVGLKLTRKPEGAAEITVYFEPGISDEMKVTFIRYVHDHLKAKGEFVVRTRHYACSKCNTPVANHEAVRRRLAEGKKDIYCVYCEERVPLWDLIEEKFASEQLQQQVRSLERKALDRIETQSRELVLIFHADSVARETGQLFNQFSHTGWGVDGEIEFTNDQGEPSGKRVYLQFKSDDYYTLAEQGGRQVFNIAKEDCAERWRASIHSVMLVVRDGNGQILWMNVTEYLKKQGKAVKQVVFDGEPFTAQSVWRMRDRLVR